MAIIQFRPLEVPQSELPKTSRQRQERINLLFADICERAAFAGAL